mgnify:CR=1 FL=1
MTLSSVTEFNGEVPFDNNQNNINDGLFGTLKNRYHSHNRIERNYGRVAVIAVSSIIAGLALGACIDIDNVSNPAVEDNESGL